MPRNRPEVHVRFVPNALDLDVLARRIVRYLLIRPYGGRTGASADWARLVGGLPWDSEPIHLKARTHDDHSNDR